MLTEPIALEMFVKKAFDNPQVAALVATWSVDFEELHDVISRNLREMGFFQVSASQTATLTQAVIEQIRWSPDVRRLLERANNVEQQRLRTRHREV